MFFPQGRRNSHGSRSCSWLKVRNESRVSTTCQHSWSCSSKVASKPSEWPTGRKVTLCLADVDKHNTRQVELLSVCTMRTSYFTHHIALFPLQLVCSSQVYLLTLGILYCFCLNLHTRFNISYLQLLRGFPAYTSLYSPARLLQPCITTSIL